MGRRFETRSAEETEHLGGTLARARRAAADWAVIGLEGDLGSGKTTFARGFLRGLGVTGAVRSPTYTLLETYTAGTQTVLHLDLYRLEDPLELEQLGLADWARSGCVWLIEWPQRGAGHLPPADVVVALSSGEPVHRIELTALTELGSAWIKSLSA